MPKCTIDGKEIEVPQGTTVIQAARDIGIHVPHFCWHPDLAVDGNCRMCLVEIEKMPKLQIACNTMIVDGMIVRTQSDELYTRQQGVLGLIISDHPDRCLTCHRMMHCPPDYICLRDVGSPYRCSTCAKNRRCDLQAMTDALRAHAPGDVVEVAVRRNGELVTLKVTLGRRGG